MLNSKVRRIFASSNRNKDTMKVEITVTSVSHDDLVTLFSDVCQTNFNIDVKQTKANNELICRIKEEYKNRHEAACREDIWAEVLLRGGNLLFIDDYEVEDEMELLENSISGNWQIVSMYRTETWFDDTNYIAYEFSLKNFLDGLSNLKCVRLMSELLEGEGDIYTASELFQRIIWNDVIY